MKLKTPLSSNRFGPFLSIFDIFGFAGDNKLQPNEAGFSVALWSRAEWCWKRTQRLEVFV